MSKSKLTNKKNIGPEKKEKKEYLKYLIALVTIASFSLNFVQWCENKALKIDKENLEYRLNALNYQPRLEIDGAPTVSSSFYVFKHSKWTSPDSIEGDSMAVINADSLLINLHFKLKNVGNSLAKLIMYAVTDTFLSEPLFRDCLLDSSKWNLFEQVNYFDDYLKTDIVKDDTVGITYKLKANFVRNNRINTHVYILYENELGQLYDTYNFAIFTIPSIFKTKLVENKGSEYVTIYTKPIEDIEKLSHSSLSKPSYYTYTKEENELLNLFLELNGIHQSKKKSPN